MDVKERSVMDSSSANGPGLEDRGRGRGRREFLVLGAAGFLPPWVTRLASAASLPTASGLPQIVAPPVQMSIGFVQGSGELKSLRRLPWETAQRVAEGEEPQRFEIASAKDLPLGDQKLANEVVKV